MNLSFQIQSLQLLIFYTDNKELWAIRIIFFYVSFYNIIKVIHFLYRFIIMLHLISSLSLTKSFLVPYAYFSVELIDCILLSSFELKTILLTSSVKTLYLLNLCCIYNLDLLFFINSLILFMSILFFSK